MTQAYRAQEGATINHTPSSAVDAGDVVVQGDLVGIAAVEIPADRIGALAVEGLFSVVKANGSITAGAKLYWDADGDPQGGTAGTGCLTTTSTGNTYFGLAAKAAAETDQRVLVLKAAGPGVVTQNELASLRSDPGNAGAIPVAYSGSVQLVTAGAETRTLAAPSFVGQMLAISMKTDGGNCVVTCATTVNQTGNNTLTFADAGDTIVLVAVEIDANKRWRTVGNDGVALSTV